MSNLEQRSTSGSSSGDLLTDKRNYQQNERREKWGYGTFAEQFLEPVVTPQEYGPKNFTVTVCTFRGIPTIDDW